jgi:hypothetical protein
MADVTNLAKCGQNMVTSIFHPYDKTKMQSENLIFIVGKPLFF